MKNPGMRRALVIVLDSVGCGGAKDAADYGDDGADTLGHLFERTGLELPNLSRLWTAVPSLPCPQQLGRG